MIEQKFRPEDILLALGLLTRLPGGQRHSSPAGAGWAFPVAGLAVGALQAVAGSLAVWAGLGAPIGAAVAVFAGVLVTGALHEDGLADCADACGAAARSRRLEIMRDSTIGTFGAVALILAFLFRWTLLAMMFEAGYIWIPLILAGMGSRAAVSVVMCLLAPARPDGLGQMMAGARGLHGAAAMGILGIGLIILLPGGFAPVAIWLAAGIAICLERARHLFGGQTGDVLGSVQIICEITLLAAISLQL